MLLSRHDERIITPCLFCNSRDVNLVTLDEGVFGDLSAFVQCEHCKARGPRYGITAITLSDKGVATITTFDCIAVAEEKAINAWNSARP